jgi:CRP-like cAMP-binding protein
VTNILDLHPAPPRNHLLAALPVGELAILLPRMERIELSLRQVLQRPEQPITSVHFPEAGWVSIINLLSDGGAAEVGHAGREGMLGLPLLYGVDTSTTEGMVQAPGTALRMSAEAFRDGLERCPDFQALLLRYALAFNEEVAQTAVCNGRHVLERRLSRWLLMVHDRAESNDVPITQDILAMILCVHRPGVSIALGRLQHGGHIRTGRGTITDRQGLENAACDCYALARRRFEVPLDITTG